MKKILLAVFGMLLLSNIYGQGSYKYRLSLVDKSGSYDLLDNPEQLLSERALNRRLRQGIEVDTTDLPVSDLYLQTLREAGLTIVTTSRWMNTVVVQSSVPAMETTLKTFPFVTDARLIWKSVSWGVDGFIEEIYEDTRSASDMRRQLRIHNGIQLHQAGYQGEGMLVAVIDGGFLNTDVISMINQNVVGHRDFVTPDSDIFATHYHGTSVLSAMSANDFLQLQGSAPNASYWLLRSEDNESEYPVEEDYWIAAAEFADSLGVDVINSSLGYNRFDDPSMDYTRADLDGNTAFITRGANAAFTKGMMIVNSAGNERNNTWQTLIVPSDSPNVLTVGALNTDMEPATFTSPGFTRPFVKPDVVSMGQPTYIVHSDGTVGGGSGTSFASPVIAGLVTCLWQALPQLKNHELMDLIRKNSNQFASPDSLKGYGVPDFLQAYLTTDLRSDATSDSDEYRFYPMDQQGNIWCIDNLPEDQYQVRVFDLAGQLMEQCSFNGCRSVLNFNGLRSGLYILNLNGK